MKLSPNLRPLPSSLALLALWTCGPSFEDAQIVWQRTHPASYVFEYQRSCRCPGSGLWWRVTVRNDSVVAVQLLDASANDHPADYSLSMSHPTLSQMFEGLAAFAGEPHTWTRVHYDAHWRFPNRASGDATDRTGSRWGFKVRNFRPLQ